MKIGDYYDVARVGIAEWRKLARMCSVPEDRVLAMLTDMARELPDQISAARDQSRNDGLGKAVIGPLARQLNACRRYPLLWCRPRARRYCK